MWFGVLGQLAMRRVDGTEVPIPGPARRQVLAAMLCRPGAMVTTAALVEDLWGSAPPRSAVSSLHSHIMRLRAALAQGGDESLLVTVGDGYRLDIAAEDVDAGRFDALVDQAGRTSDANAAIACYDHALALWRDEPYVEFGDAPFAVLERIRLTELRALAQERRTDLALAAGTAGELVGDLEARVRAEPYRERGWEQLALALYRAGRQADALGACRRARVVLAEDLGVDPGPGLQTLEQRLLAQDPELVVFGPQPLTVETVVEGCPYLGLAAYEEQDAALFVGRERLTSMLAGRLADQSVVVVTGASGVGKSSLVRAGLVPALRAGALPGSSAWRIEVRTAGGGPLADPDRPPDLLVLDQAEELFTGLEPAARDELLARLARYVTDSAGRLVLVLRSDFYARLAELETLRAFAEQAPVLVGPMRADELRRALVEPAARARLRLQDELIEMIMDDVAGQPEPLPLLSEAMVRTWARREGDLLTLSGYEQAGELAGALQAAAEECYTSLDDAQQRAARHLLVRLAARTDTGWVRRPITTAQPADEHEQAALAALVTARLVVADQHRIEISHEALLAHWPRLRDWLDERALAAGLLEHLEQAATEWNATGRQHSDLYRGPRLSAATDWRTEHPEDLTPAEDEFLDASAHLADAELQAARAQIAREIRGRRSLRRIAIALAAVVLLALAGGAIALVERSNADRQRHAATTQVRLTLGRQLGASSLVNQPLDHSLLLAVSAVRIDNSPNTRGDLLAALQRSPAAKGIWRQDGTPDPLMGIVVTDHDQIALTSGAAGVATWRLQRSRTPDLTRKFEDFGSDVPPVLAARPRSNEVAIANLNYPDETPVLRLWDPTRGEQIGRDLSGATSRIHSLAWSPEGRYLAAAQERGDVLIWDLTHPARQPAHIARQRPQPPNFYPYFPAVGYAGPHTYTVVEANGFGQVSRSGAAHPQRTFDAGIGLTAVAGNPQGTQLAFGHADGSVTLMSLADLRPSPLTSHFGPVDGISFSADGRLIATMGDDDAINVTNVTTGQLVGRLTGHVAPVIAGAFTADDHQLYTASFDGTVIDWDLANLNNLGTELAAPVTHGRIGDPVSTRSSAANLAVSRTGEIAVEYNDGTMRIWSQQVESRSWVIRVSHSPLTGGSFSPDGRWFAVADGSGAVQLVDVAARRIVTTLVHLRDAYDPEFSPDGRTIAVVDDDGDATLIDTATRHPMGAPFYTIGHPRQVAWSPDSRKLAVEGSNGELAVYDLRTRALLWESTDAPPMAWSPTGSVIATRNEVLRAADGAVLSQGWNDHQSECCNNLTYSPDGTLLASTGDDGIVLRDVTTGQQFGPPLTPQPNNNNDYVLAGFDGSGRLIVSSGDNGLWRWHVNLPYLIQQACSIAGRNLTQDEWASLDTNHSYVTACP